VGVLELLMLSSFISVELHNVYDGALAENL